MMRDYSKAVVVVSMFTMIGSAAYSEDPVKIIKISARKFEYSPREFTLKKGASVVLQLTAEDRSHGFNIPSMKVRADVVPGKVTELTITPQKAGEFEYFCDIFCGGGHDAMNGTIKVVE